MGGVTKESSMGRKLAESGRNEACTPWYAGFCSRYRESLRIITGVSGFRLERLQLDILFGPHGINFGSSDVVTRYRSNDGALMMKWGNPSCRQTERERSPPPSATGWPRQPVVAGRPHMLSVRRSRGTRLPARLADSRGRRNERPLSRGPRSLPRLSITIASLSLPATPESGRTRDRRLSGPAD